MAMLQETQILHIKLFHSLSMLYTLSITPLQWSDDHMLNQVKVKPTQVERSQALARPSRLLLNSSWLPLAYNRHIYTSNEDTWFAQTPEFWH